MILTIVAVLQMESLFVDCSRARRSDCKKFRGRNYSKYLKLGLFGANNYPAQPSLSNCYCPPPGAKPAGFAQLDPNCPLCPDAPPAEPRGAPHPLQPGMFGG